MARKAIALDERSADAHSALATAILYFEWNWVESEREHRRAIACDPTNADAHFRYALTYLRSVGRYEEALTELERAAALDPVLPVIPAGLGLVLTYAHRYDEAIAAFKQALTLEPDFISAHRDLASVYRLKGLGDLAIAESRQTIALGEPTGRASLAQSYLVAGRRGDAVALLKELVDQREQSRGGARGIALVFAALGDATQACSWLEQAFKARDPNLVFLDTDPGFDSLRADPRFTDLVRRVGIPER
jgi:tetratricopeptide (TPR) repeat protein